MDLFGSIYLAWLLVESPLWSRSKLAWLRKAPRPAMAALLLVLALSRGGYVMFVERTGHPVLEANLAPSDWHEVMEWAATQPLGTHFLAEPDHAVRYGTSIRASGGQDVFLEIIKDTGIAIYSADIAHRLSQRVADLGDRPTVEGYAVKLVDNIRVLVGDIDHGGAVGTGLRNRDIPVTDEGTVELLPVFVRDEWWG